MDRKTLADALPLVRAWTDRTLAAHRLQARQVASYRFCRLGQFFSAELLSSSLVVEVPRVPVPPLAEIGLAEFAEFLGGDYDGITYLNTYFVRESRAHDESLNFHELVHVVQWQHLGPDRFLMAYAAGCLVAGGYRVNPLETMAYDLEEQFDAGLPIRDLEGAVRRELDQAVPRLLAEVFGV